MKSLLYVFTVTSMTTEETASTESTGLYTLSYYVIFFLFHV